MAQAIEAMQPLNEGVCENLLSLAQREVTTHFRQLDAFPGLIGPGEAEILRSLRALKGMWAKPSNEPIAPGAWPYQINGCPACIMARIGSDKAAVQNLQVVLRSRTRTRTEHRPCRLTRFINACIDHFGQRQATEIHELAGLWASEMKATRKRCVKRWMHDPAHRAAEETRRMRHRHHRGKQPSGSSLKKANKGIDERSKGSSYGQQPSIVFTDVSVNESSGRTNGESTPLRTLGSAVPQPREPVREQSRWSKSEKALMYERLAHANPYSRHTPVDEAMIEPLSMVTPRRSRDSICTTFEGLARGFEYDDTSYRSRRGSVLRNELGHNIPLLPLPGHKNGPIEPDSVQIMVGYRPTSSDYSSGMWTDDSCGSDWRAARVFRNVSPAAEATSWDLLCDHHNFI
ncbi:hypothetical protein N7462_006157 [Penicillium macrosclerotiorum]|uniref:uncharacterized protein n=1 Tax=Penicillium macrosclerotiorum TaxID=303699 RepID=UPI002546E7C2|nr:uncharacterized protein N7462_006157 [Penicillium macrosclerotiorum]KAJ5682992.1 hypothetical protein N7462_006157 [Penicillium macrosclerotiorum]